MAADPNCLFCKIATGEIPAKLAFQNDEMVAFHDINPAAPTHILIIPREHIVNTSEINDQNAPLIGRMIQTAAQLAREQGIEADGYRLVTNSGTNAGQSVWHLHLHLLGGRKMTWPPG
jgi:histidine triad (HIT) family protein